MMNCHKPHKRRGPKNRVKSWLMRPSTIRIAFVIARLIALVAKVINLF